MSLSAEGWRRIRAVFAEVVALPPADRAARLDRLGVTEPALRAEIDTLLDAADRVGERFERGPSLDPPPEPANGP